LWYNQGLYLYFVFERAEGLYCGTIKGSICAVIAVSTCHGRFAQLLQMEEKRKSQRGYYWEADSEEEGEKEEDDEEQQQQQLQAASSPKTVNPKQIEKGSMCWYRDSDGSAKKVEVLSVNRAIFPPTYVIRIDGRERETEVSSS